MKTLVILPLLLCMVQAADKPDVKAKATPSPANTIPQNPKYETVYQQVKYQQPLQQQIQVQPVQLQAVQHLQNQQKSYYLPMQIIQQKPYYVPQPQPQAMIIIAQPALVPQSLLYGNPTQQLLNYFHSNPQAKYQLLHGNYQQQPHQIQPQPTQAQVQPTATYMHPVLATPLGNYILASPQVGPQHQLLAHGSPLPTPAVYSTQQPQLQVQQTQLSSLAHHHPQLNSLAQHQPQLSHLSHQQHQLSHLSHHQPQLTHLSHQQPQLTHLSHQHPQLTHLSHQQPQLTHLSHQQPQLAHLSQQQPQQYTFTHTQQQPTQASTAAAQQQPQVGSLAQLAQLAAQQYASSSMKTAPAIVTGFENFTPEQQAQIKTQLSSHLGANYHAVSNPNQGQYSAKYAAEQENANFNPSPQVTKNEPATTSNSQIGDILKTRYVKGKN